MHNDIDTSMHVLSAVASIGALGRENDQLLKGTAKQATTIRTLNERNSNLEAEVTLEKYNVEFLKNQGRKTRDKNTGIIKALKARLAYMHKMVTQHEAARVKAADALTILRSQQERLLTDHFELQRKYAELAQVNSRFIWEGYQQFNVGITRHVDARAMVTDYELRFDHSAFRQRWSGDAVTRMSPDAIRVMADVTAHTITKGIRERVVNTILTHFKVEPETLGQRAEKMMRQQRQTY